MSRRRGWFVVGGLAVALVLAFVVTRVASSAPDGLSKVAADTGLDGGRRPHDLEDGPLAGYATRGVGDSGLSTGLAGAIGVASTFAVAGGTMWLVARRRPRVRSTSPPPIS
jgi:hypothetical protein